MAISTPQAERNLYEPGNRPPSGATPGSRPITHLERVLDRELIVGWRPLPRQEIPAVSQDINVLALVKGVERYVFLYDDSSRAETLRTLADSPPTRS